MYGTNARREIDKCSFSSMIEDRGMKEELRIPRPRSQEQQLCYYSALQHEHIIWGLTGLDYNLIDQWLEHLLILEKHPSYKENIELDGYSYEAIKNRNMNCLKLLKKLAQRRQVEIVGGSYSAPPMILIDGESSIRQILMGKEAIKRLLGVNVKSFSVQEGGICIHPQLPQILRQTGYDSCVLGCMNDYLFIQGKGVDGTSIPTVTKTYWDPLPNDPKNIPEILKVCKQQGNRLIMPTPDWSWGAAKSEWIEEALKQREIKIVTASVFFDENVPKHEHMLSEVEWKPETKIVDLGAPRVATLLDVGNACEIPKENKRAENLLITTEKYQSVASFFGLKPKVEELSSCWKKLFIAQAHDIYWDGSLDSLKAWSVKLLRQVSKKAKKLVLEALSYLAERVDTNLRVSGWKLIPLVVFNQLSWRRESVVIVDQSFEAKKARTVALIDGDDNFIPYEIEDVKKHPDGSLKRIKACFMAELPPFGYSTYYIGYKRVGEIADQTVRTKGKGDAIGNEMVGVKCEDNGEIRIRDLATSKEVFQGGFLTLYDKEGWDDSRQHPVNLRPLKRGKIKSSFIVRGQFRQGSYRTTITVNKGSREVYFNTKIKVSDAILGKHVYWWCMHPESSLANNLIFNIDKGTLCHDYPFGCCQTDSTMIFPLNFIDYSNSKQGISVFHSGTHGFWIKGREPLNLLNLWLWSPPGSEINWSKAKRLPKRGTYNYRYAIMPHPKNWMEGRVFQKSLEYNNPQLIVKTSLHSGPLPKQKSFVNVDKNNVILSALIPQPNRATARLYEIYGQKTDFNLALNFPHASKAWDVNMKGNIKSPLTIAHGSLSSSINPHEIVNLTFSGGS